MTGIIQNRTSPARPENGNAGSAAEHPPPDEGSFSSLIPPAKSLPAALLFRHLFFCCYRTDVLHLYGRAFRSLFLASFVLFSLHFTLSAFHCPFPFMLFVLLQAMPALFGPGLCHQFFDRLHAVSACTSKYLVCPPEHRWMGSLRARTKTLRHIRFAQGCRVE